MISSATGPPTFAQLRPTVYNISIACEAASGHTWYVRVQYLGRSCERVWPSCGLEEIILCSFKMLFIVCYIASVPVCVFCDGRTHGQTHNPILSGIRCFLRRRAQRRNANSQIIVLIIRYVRTLKRVDLSLLWNTVRYSTQYSERRDEC